MQSIVKKIFWALVALLIIGQVHAIASIVLHPIGGRELHEIFAYFSGGRLEVAKGVFWEYVIISAALSFVMICCFYPSHWLVITSMAWLVAWLRWQQICHFPYATAAFQDACRPMSYIIGPVVLVWGVSAHFLSRRLIPGLFKKYFKATFYQDRDNE